MLLVGPPGAGEQNKGPAGQIWGSEERGCPETTGSQVFYLAAVQWAHMLEFEFSHISLQIDTGIHIHSAELFITVFLCFFTKYLFIVSFIVFIWPVLIRSSAAEYLSSFNQKFFR